MSRKHRKEAVRQGIDLRDLDDHFEMEKRPSTAAPVGYMTGSGGGRGQRRHSPTYETYGGNARPSATYKDEGKTEFITEFGSSRPDSSRKTTMSVNWNDVEASHTVIVPKERAVPTAKAEAPKPKGKETPQERLKRLMAMQLNKQARKDTAAERQKKLREEKERLDTMESMRAAQARAKDAAKESSHEPEHRYNRRSYSRSPSPSRSPPPRARRSPSPRRGSRSPSPRARSPDRYRVRDRERSYERDSRSLSRSPSPVRYRGRGRRYSDDSDSDGYRRRRR